MKFSSTFGRNILRGSAVALALVAAPALMAQEGPKFGGSLSFALPQGDLAGEGDVSRGMGFGIGGFFEMPFTSALAGVASVQYLKFGELEYDGHTFDNTGMSAVGLNVDLKYYFGEDMTGFYGLAGLGFHSMQGDWDNAESETAFGFGVGAGYYFTPNLGAEARYFAGTISGENGAPDFDASWLQLSVKYRF